MVEPSIIAAALAVRDELRHQETTQRLAEARTACPELLRLVDGLADAVDVLDPPTPIFDA